MDSPVNAAAKQVEAGVEHTWQFVRVAFYDARLDYKICEYRCERCGMETSSDCDPGQIKVAVGCDNYLVRTVMGR